MARNLLVTGHPISMAEKDKIDTLREIISSLMPEADRQRVDTIVGAALAANLGDQKALLTAAIKGELPVNNNGSSYYKETYALQILPDIKHAMETGDILFYAYSDYKKSPKSVYLYVNDAFRFIADNFDDEKGTLKAFRESVSVCQGKTGVIVKAKKTPRDGAIVLKAHRIKASEWKEEEEEIARPDSWKEEMITWRNSSPQKGELFERDIDLTPIEEADLNSLFENDEDYGLVISRDKKSFKIRRMT